jgi:hypothetical protein
MPAPAGCQHQRPSQVGVHQPGGRRTARHLAFPPPFRRGQTLTDRDQVDVVPGQTSRPAATILPIPKNADAVPSPAASSLPRISGILPLASGPRPAVTNTTLQFRDLSQPRTCGSDAPRRPVADRMDRAGNQRSLADRSLPARGRHPHFFTSRMAAARRGSPPRHRIHPIAIRRRRPGLEGRCIGSWDGTPAGTSWDGSFRTGQSPAQDDVASIGIRSAGTPRCGSGRRGRTGVCSRCVTIRIQ